MTDFQIYLTIGVFAAVILLIAFDLIDMTVAALLGVSVLIVFGILDGSDLMPIMHTAGGPLALLFGGMVVARVIGKTGIFDWIGDAFLRATGGSGRRFLLLIVALVAPVCAFLPNATAVILVAPVIVGVCQALEVDFVGPLIITAIVSNAAGMLTLVGDPATFLVGSAIGLSFADYLRMVSLGGLLAVLAVVPLLPLLLPKIWATRVTLLAERPRIAIERPAFLILALLVLLIMVVLFLVGESLPTRIVPPQVAIIVASLALLVVYGARIEPVGAVIRDVDWKTLVFLGAIFTLVRAFIKTELLQGLSIQIYQWFGADLLPVAFLSLAGIGILSSLLANIPVVAAALVMITGYLVAAQAVPEIALAAGFTDWPNATLPVFVAMMFGGTLGGNATLIGASANVVAAGICTSRGQHVSFVQFLRIGLPIAVVQLSVGALYVWVLASMLG
ncbi:MAG: SLC13 family permease [Candidatus Competibacter sp.]|nr:SLC13 family permease [Candidatus Competibacter sp.]